MQKLTIAISTFSLLAGLLPAQQVVVANRGSGDITVINARTNKVAKTVNLPKGTNKPEPMYVADAAGEVMVGDRANNRIVRFDRHTYKVKGTITVGKGVFHMWPNRKQLWVNNDIDKTTSVISLKTMKEVTAIPIPSDLAKKGYKPHDVFATKNHGYVSLLGGSDKTDWVVQFSTKTFKETRRAAVGKDPHLWVDGNRLYVAAQNANAVHVLHARSLNQLQVVKVPGAHGIYKPRWTRSLFVTNISGGGKDGLVELSLSWRGGARVKRTVDTKYATPHNIAALPFGRGIYVTHSGATANQVTIYGLRGWSWWSQLRPIGEVKAGTNPFGLAYIR